MEVGADTEEQARLSSHTCGEAELGDEGMVVPEQDESGGASEGPHDADGLLGVEEDDDADGEEDGDPGGVSTGSDQWDTKGIEKEVSWTRN